MKARGFSRPPGSPRLITRLRRIRELQINRAGQITLVESESAAAPAATGLPGPGTRAVRPGARALRPAAHAPGPDPRRETYEERRAEVEAALRGETVPAYVEPVVASSAPVAR